jgi:phosphate transport system substrate-binding protein
MALQYGKCTNFGLCVKADTRETQTIPEGAEFICQECKRPLAPAGASAPGGRRRATPLLVLAFLLLLVGGMSYYFRHRSSRAQESQSAPIAVPENATVILRLSGSNTIGARLAPDLVEAWLASTGAHSLLRSAAANDETTITGTLNGSAVAVRVKAHGSVTAFTDLGADACDVGMASRKIKAGEAAGLESKGLGDLTSNANERVVGLDGVAVIVNESNDTDTLTKDEIAEIFSGAGSKRSWHVYARDDKSGTYDTFKDRVLGNRTLLSSAKRFEDSRELASAVLRDRDGIGFVGLPYAAGVKVLAVAEKGAAALVPNTMTVRTESYPLSRRLYLYIPDNAKQQAREFVRFALSPQGQDIVEKDGFVGQKVDVMKEQAPAQAPKGYVELMPSADRLSVDFRFRTGSSQLDSKAVDDIKRVAAAMSSQYAGRGVMLVGFADSTGNPAANLRLSKDRAQSVAAQMQHQGITPVFVTGFGQDLPVADNSTPEGREKNRRVEVWLRK